MSLLSSLAEFLSRPREWHALGLGFILAYLGVFHQPLAGLLTPLAFGIGLMIIGVRAKAVRDYFNRVILPEKTKIPDDIRAEWIYYWVGIFLVYFLKSVSSFLL